MKEYGRKNKDYIREQRRQHYIAHREEINERSKRWARENKEYCAEKRKRDRIKVVARRIVRDAIKIGLLIKTPCAACKETEKIQAHHQDYLKPLEIIWLCPPCHHALHRGLVPLHKIQKSNPPSLPGSAA